MWQLDRRDKQSMVKTAWRKWSKQWKQGWAVRKQREKIPHQEFQKNWSSNQHTPPCVFIQQAWGWHCEHILNKHLGFFQPQRVISHCRQTITGTENALFLCWHQWCCSTDFCPIHATLPVLCATTAEITLLAAAVLCRIPPSWHLQTALHRTAQSTEKKKYQYFRLLLHQRAQHFPFPTFIFDSSLLSLPLRCLSTCSHNLRFPSWAN